MHTTIAQMQEPDTCTWMTESDLWRDWLQGEPETADGCRRFMWIYGLPGTGKTVLASFLIDNLLDKLSRGRPGSDKFAHGLSYYYCHQKHDRDEALPFLRWVVRDLCQQLFPRICQADRPRDHPDRSIPEQLQQMWQRQQISINGLMDCLQALVGRFRSQYHRRVYIIVDAIDESKAPRATLLNILTKLGTDVEWENVSLLITSREHQDIQRAFKFLPLPTGGLPVRPAPTHQQPSIASTSANLEGSSRPQTPLRRSSALKRPRSPTETFEQSSDHITELDSPLPPQKRPSPTKKMLAKDQGDTHVSLCTSLSMDNHHVKQAIRVYVERRLQDSSRFGTWPRPEFLVVLRRELAAKAGGIFRVVVCHLDLIDRRDLTDESRILDLIKTMPGSIFEAYEQILLTLVPDDGDENREDREFARTALTLMCSDTANIPNAEVLIAASRTTLPQLEARFYTREKLRALLGCLVEVTPDLRPRTVFERQQESRSSAQLLSVAHYTVKEFLHSQMAANGLARYFAMSAHTNQILELRIAFDGLRHFNTGPRAIPTRYEEYCLEMTDKALALRPVIVEKGGKLWDVVLACLRFDAPHRAWIATYGGKAKGGVKLVKQYFPTWNNLSPFERDGFPSREGTSILVNLLLLQWPEHARDYLSTLSVRRRDVIWRDTFKLSVQQSKSLPQTTLAQMCVSRRRLDFLQIFTTYGLHFQDSCDDILFRALGDAYERDDGDDGITLALLKELLLSGADPNPEGFKVTPLQVATHCLEPSWVHELLSTGAHEQAIGETAGVDPLPPPDESDDRKWYKHKPLKICMDRSLDNKRTLGMQQGVKRVIERYMNREVIVVD